MAKMRNLNTQKDARYWEKERGYNKQAAINKLKMGNLRRYPASTLDF